MPTAPLDGTQMTPRAPTRRVERFFFSRLLWTVLLMVRPMSTLGDAADSRYETVFVVGPAPQPLLPDAGNAATRSEYDDAMVPLPAASIPQVAGERKLRSSAVTQTTSSSVQVDAAHKNIDRLPRRFPRKHSHYYHVPYDNVTVPASRSMGEDCTITTTLLGFAFDDNVVETGTTWIPPDPHGAAGASRLVAVGNSLMEVRRKNGTLTLRRGFQNFFAAFSEARDTNFFFDPRVVYDEHAGRFVLVVFQRRFAPDVSRIWLSVSKGETPDTIADWNQVYINGAVSINGSRTWVDFPGVEVDEEAVYITANMYRFSDGMYAGVRLWIVDKGVQGGVYAGKAPSFMRTDPVAKAGIAGTTMPAQIHGSTGVDGSVGTFLSNIIAYPDGQTYLQIVTVFNPLKSPTYTIQTIDLGIITQGSVLPLAPQRGTTTKIATNDARILDAVWRNQKLWVVFIINPIVGMNRDQSTAHWVRCRTSGGTVTYEAQGDLGGEGIAAGTFTYIPSVAVNMRGLVAYGYSASSPTTFAGAYSSVGTSQQSYTVRSGLAPYARLYADNENRWGDYSGISVDPTDDSFWVFNQYADIVGSLDDGGNGRWATAWGRLECTVSCLPLSFITFTYLILLVGGCYDTIECSLAYAESGT
jgi:hypothetical protein